MLASHKQRMVDALEAFTAGAPRGELLPMRDVRRSLAHVHRRDELLLELARDGVLSLHRHDYVAPLTVAEVADLLYVADQSAGGCGSHPRGMYFVGVAIRQS